MTIQITKQPDGSGVLRCVRDDGSVTWQQQTECDMQVALHDLTQFAVETVLGYNKGFFGLIDAGWEVEDTTGNGKRGSLPGQALIVKHIVSLFESEQGAGVLWTFEKLKLYAPAALSVA